MGGQYVAVDNKGECCAYASPRGTHTMSQIHEIISPLLAEVELALAGAVTTGVPTIDEMALYALSGGGKRLRPAVFLLCAKSLSADSKRLGDMAAAIELIHTASLLHDDIVDESHTRRWRESVQLRWGKRLAVLVGDHLWQRALALSIKAGGKRLLEVVSDSVGELVKGELIEAVQGKSEMPSKANYLEIIEGKTARLFSMAARCGAIIAGAKAKQEGICASFGLAFGMAYQLIDDANDYAADEKSTGKPSLQDISCGRVTYPLIAAMESMDESRRAEILSIVQAGRACLDTARGVAKTVVLSDGIGRTLSLANDYLLKARELALCLPVSGYSRELVELTQERPI